MMEWETGKHTCNKHEVTLQVVFIKDAMAKIIHILMRSAQKVASSFTWFAMHFVTYVYMYKKFDKI